MRALPLILLTACAGIPPTYRWEVTHFLTRSDGAIEVGFNVYRRDGDEETMTRVRHVEGETIGVGPFDTGAILTCVEKVKKDLPGPVCPICPTASNPRTVPYQGKHVVVQTAEGKTLEWWFPSLALKGGGPCAKHR